MTEQVRMIKDIGFTGTRTGMTNRQQSSVQVLLMMLGAGVLHHGDCVGADDQMDQIGHELGLDICLHPPLDPKHRAWCNTRPYESVLICGALPYLQRNHAIVVDTEGLIAAPSTGIEQGRSGTWATIRYGLRSGKPVWIVRPDGSVKFRGPK